MSVRLHRRNMSTKEQPRGVVLVAIGLLGGVFSGVFGIGGGTIIVPALITLARLSHRQAAGTSVAAIVPAAVVGSGTYIAQGHFDWLAALLLAVGMIVGAQVGSKLLAVLPVWFLQSLFLCFMLIVIVMLWIVVPTRDQVIDIALGSGIGLAVTGFVTGILSNLLGVGGGVVVVPVMMFFFGANDLAAKGTSLLMMIPGAVSGTVGNALRGNVNLRAAAYVGVAAAVAAPLGALIAASLDPQWANIAFSVFLGFISGQMLLSLIRSRHQRQDHEKESSR